METHNIHVKYLAPATWRRSKKLGRVGLNLLGRIWLLGRVGLLKYIDLLRLATVIIAHAGTYLPNKTLILKKPVAAFG